MEPDLCARCSCSLRQGRTFTFRTAVGRAAMCFVCSLRHWPILRRSLITAALVGSILTLLNQGNYIFSGTWTLALYWKVPLTYLVPFLVATWGPFRSAAAEVRVPQPAGGSGRLGI